MENIQKNQGVVALDDDDLLHISGGAGGTGTVVSSGSFESNTGSGLNIRADWSVTADNGTKTLHIDVSTLSYGLQTNPLDSGVTVTVNGQTYAGTTGVSYSGKTLAANHVASVAVEGFSGSAIATVVYTFKGTYGGVAIENITASGVCSAG